MLRPEPVSLTTKTPVDGAKNFEVEEQSWDVDVVSTSTAPILPTVATTSDTEESEKAKNIPLIRNISKNALSKISRQKVTDSPTEPTLVVEDHSNFEARNEANFKQVSDSESPVTESNSRAKEPPMNLKPDGRLPRVKSNLRFQNNFGRKKVIVKKKNPHFEMETANQENDNGVLCK